jgi:hypothetical protein
MRPLSSRFISYLFPPFLCFSEIMSSRSSKSIVPTGVLHLVLLLPLLLFCLMGIGAVGTSKFWRLAKVVFELLVRGCLVNVEGSVVVVVVVVFV